MLGVLSLTLRCCRVRGATTVVGVGDGRTEEGRFVPSLEAQLAV